MINIDIPIPKKGVFLRHAPQDIGREGAAKLHNLRIDEGIVHNRPGLSAYHSAFDSKHVVDGFTVEMRDGDTRTIRCTIDTTQYDSGAAWTTIPLDGAWTGSAKDRFWAVVAPWAGTDPGRVIISNGIDIKEWDGVPANDMQDVASGPPGRYGLVGPDHRVFSGWVQSGGSNWPRLVQWSVPLLPNGAAADWTDPGSGTISLENDSWEITAMWVQSGRIWVGKERSIVRLDPTGLPRDAYGLSPLHSGREGGDGPLPGSLVQFGNSVAFISLRDVLIFEPPNLIPVGGPIVRELFHRINHAALRGITSVVDSAEGRVGWGIPMDGNATPTEIWWLEVKTGRWETESRTHTSLFLHGFSSPIFVDDLTAAYPPGKVDDLPGKVNALSNPATTPPKIVLGRSDGVVAVVDNNAVDDLGVDFVGDYRSPAVNLVGQPTKESGAELRPERITYRDFAILDEVRVLLADKGVDYTIEIQASTDSGASWTSLGTITLVSTASEDARRLVRRFLTARYPADTEVQVRIINQTSGVKWGFGTISLVLDPAGRAL